MREQAVLQLRGVTKKIGSRTIVDHLSFDVRPGEVCGFLGPNGAGKATTIRMIVGLMSISEGEIFVKPACQRHADSARHDDAVPGIGAAGLLRRIPSYILACLYEKGCGRLGLTSSCAMNIAINALSL